MTRTSNAVLSKGLSDNVSLANLKTPNDAVIFMRNISQKLGKINDYTELIQYTQKNKKPCLSRCIKVYGEDKVSALISGYIVSAIEFFNIDVMSADLILQTTQLIIESHKGTLTIPDIHLFFKCVKRGDYGGVGNRIDGQKILMWLQRYIDERGNIAAQINESKHLATKIGCSDVDRVCLKRDDDAHKLDVEYFKEQIKKNANEREGKEE